MLILFSMLCLLVLRKILRTTKIPYFPGSRKNPTLELLERFLEAQIRGIFFFSLWKLWLPIHIYPISQLRLSSRNLIEIEPSWSDPFLGNEGICHVFLPPSIFGLSGPQRFPQEPFPALPSYLKPFLLSSPDSSLAYILDANPDRTASSRQAFSISQLTGP